MISVILMEPRNSGNIGAIARTMKNFQVNDLVLINPKCNHLSQTARNRAKHANEILEKAKIKKYPFLKKFDYIVATTAIIGTDYNIPRSPISPKELSKKVEGINKKIGILIGRESSGLTNAEIQDSDFVISIPTSPIYQTMNISHAVSIILYELFQKSKKPKINDHIIFVSNKEKEVINKMFNKILNKLEFSTKEKKDTQKKTWT